MNKSNVDNLAREIKMLLVRSKQRGLKETCVILGAFSERNLKTLDPGSIVAYSALLDESDQDIMNWVLRSSEPPRGHCAIVQTIIYDLEANAASKVR